MDIERGVEIDIRPWSDTDHWLLERLMGDPEMTLHLGGPESTEKIQERHERYCRGITPGEGAMFAIVVGQERTAAGSVGYWETEWRGQVVWEIGWSVLPEFQGLGAATRATAPALERARHERKHRFAHAFPSVANAPSNAICRKLGFSFRAEVELEYPPGTLMRCNDWRLDLYTDQLASGPRS